MTCSELAYRESTVLYIEEGSCNEDTDAALSCKYGGSSIDYRHINNYYFMVEIDITV